MHEGFVLSVKKKKKYCQKQNKTKKPGGRIQASYLQTSESACFLKNISPKTTSEMAWIKLERIKLNRLLNFLLNRDEWYLFLHPGCPHEGAFLLSFYCVTCSSRVNQSKITVVVKFWLCFRISIICLYTHGHTIKRKKKQTITKE